MEFHHFIHQPCYREAEAFSEEDMRQAFLAGITFMHMAARKFLTYHPEVLELVDEAAETAMSMNASEASRQAYIENVSLVSGTPEKNI